jgi:hypothetical protein
MLQTKFDEIDYIPYLPEDIKLIVFDASRD